MDSAIHSAAILTFLLFLPFPLIFPNWVTIACTLLTKCLIGPVEGAVVFDAVDEAQLSALLAGQSPNGSWTAESLLSAVPAISPTNLSAYCPQASLVQMWATAVAAVFLEANFPSVAPRWNAQVGKARNWVACNAPGLRLMNEAFQAATAFLGNESSRLREAWNRYSFLGTQLPKPQFDEAMTNLVQLHVDQQTGAVLLADRNGQRYVVSKTPHGLGFVSTVVPFTT